MGRDMSYRFLVKHLLLVLKDVGMHVEDLDS